MGKWERQDKEIPRRVHGSPLEGYEEDGFGVKSTGQVELLVRHACGL